MTDKAKVLSALSNRRAVTGLALHQQTDLSINAVAEALTELEAKGVVVRAGTDGWKLAPKPGAVRQQSLRDAHKLEDRIRREYYATLDEHTALKGHLLALRQPGGKNV